MRPISSIGCSTPVSLFAIMMLISLVFGWRAERIAWIDESVRVHRNISDLASAFFKHFAGVQNSMVLDRGSNHVVAGAGNFQILRDCHSLCHHW